MIRRLVILGATGDLTRRSLLPAVAALLAAGRLPADFRVTAVGRRDWDDGAYLDWLLPPSPGTDLAEPARRALEGVVAYRSADLTDPRQLGAILAPAMDPVVLYLALPPAVFAPAIEALTVAGLPTGSRVVIEKPFGSDLASARHLNEPLNGLLPEDSVYRIDHFLHKQTVSALRAFTRRAPLAEFLDRHSTRVLAGSNGAPPSASARTWSSVRSRVGCAGCWGPSPGHTWPCWPTWRAIIRLDRRAHRRSA
jgi:glucose-6-phosphate 1-dehydrogenase